MLAFSVVSSILHPHVAAQEAISAGASDKLVLAYYMPWYDAKPASPQWGWHWTMNHFDPEQEANNKRPIASQFYPLIGPYDSADVAVIDYHLETMKRAGIDGVIADLSLVVGMLFVFSFATKVAAAMIAARFRLLNSSHETLAAQQLIARNFPRFEVHSHYARMPVTTLLGSTPVSLKSRP